MKSFQYPTVDKQLLDEVVQQITAVGSPLKIVLFGSRARGDEHAESDLDLIVIEESELPTYKRASRYYFALKGISIPKDIVVRTPAEVYDWSAVPNAFITTAVREGKVIYEKILSELTNYAVESRYQLAFFPDKQLAANALSEAQLICQIVLDAQISLKNL